MKKYSNVYAWEVLDKIKNGKIVYLINKDCRNSTLAIRSVNHNMSVQELVNIVNSDNKNNQYEFFEEIRIDEQ